MSKKSIILLLLFFPLLLIGQIREQKTIAKLIISDATENGVDITQTIIEQETYLALYVLKDESLCLANVWRKNNSSSYGRIFDKKYHKSVATANEYESHIMSFRWSYENSYNTKKGTANCELIIIHKPVGKAFILTIIPENLNVLLYKGYIKGSLNLNPNSN